VAALDVVQVQFSIDDPAAADAIITALLDRHLVACAQRLGPMTSRYWWEGRQQSTEEWLIVAKTQASRADEAREAIAAVHPYDVPEILVLPVLDGHQPYVEWIAAQTP
jgi:periplasmic divalent cation tolerance protein